MTDPMTLSPGTDSRRGNLLGVIELVAVPESVHRAREFVREKLGDGHAGLDDVMLLVSELVTNSVLHSDSRGGGTVTVAIADCFDRVHVDVVDAGGEGSPRVCEEGLGEGGRGLRLVETVSREWGVWDGEDGRTVWFEVGCPG
ncbi:ATP-binding protein [Sphaerisporangium aureirubrum]|uniref:ATP-binding protein n=1 Tax=Sphaerisporangium aureirubrum TaxID=1544736 RepID=A0ABW1NMY1_9ACTN